MSKARNGKASVVGQVKIGLLKTGGYLMSYGSGTGVGMVHETLSNLLAAWNVTIGRCRVDETGAWIEGTPGPEERYRTAFLRIERHPEDSNNYPNSSTPAVEIQFLGGVPHKILWDHYRNVVTEDGCRGLAKEYLSDHWPHLRLGESKQADVEGQRDEAKVF